MEDPPPVLYASEAQLNHGQTLFRGLLASGLLTAAEVSRKSEKRDDGAMLEQAESISIGG